MSLLRRIERDAGNADDERGQRSRTGPPGTRRPSRNRTPSPLQKQWQHRAHGRLFAVALSADKRFIVAGSQNGDVLLLDDAGRQLWAAKINGTVSRIALANEAESLVVSALHEDNLVHHWHYSGRLLRTYPVEGEIWGLAITPDASLVVIGTLDKHLYGFDQAGEQVFKQTLDEPIRHLTVTADGATIFAGGDDGGIYAFDHAGTPRWQVRTEGRVYAGIRIAAEANLLVAGSNDGHVYGLDFEGAIRWRFPAGGMVNALAITPDGRFCAVGGSAATAYLLDDQGAVLWDYKTDDAIYGLALSPDGRFMAVGSHDSHLHWIDHERNHTAWREFVAGRAYAVAMSADAQLVVAASTDMSVYTFKNTAVEGDGQALTRPVSRPHCQLVVQSVRDEYAKNSHAGLVRWFSEYEKSLRFEQFDVCRALLDEAHEADSFNLSAGEREYTRSLEGAYWLFRGVAFHRREQYAEAQECYEQSKALQAELNNQDGVGQVVAALSLLPESADLVDSAEAPDSAPSPADDASDDEVGAAIVSNAERIVARTEAHKLLDEITSKPRVLGTSEKLLAHRIMVVTPPEQMEIVLLARRSGYAAPLIQALSAEERVIRAAASAGLTFLNPGPGFDVLGQMLASDQMFVRWQALRMLRGRAYDQPDEFKEAKDQLWPAVLNHTLAEAPDPLTRREAALLVQNAGSAEDTPWLIELLKDPDPDVQLAAIWALNKVGDRRALNVLDKVPGRTAFLGRSLKAAADDAASAIRDRHPLPTIEQVIFCQSDPRQARSVCQSSLFWPDVETVHCVVVVDHVKADARVTLKWQHKGEVIHQDERVIGTETTTIPTVIQETPLVEETPDRRGSSRRARPGERERPPLGERRPSRRNPFDRGSANDDETPFERSRRPRSFDRGADEGRRRFGRARSPFGDPQSGDIEQRPPLARRTEPASPPSRRPERPSRGRFSRDRTRSSAPESPPRPSRFSRRPALVDPVENIAAGNENTPETAAGTAPTPPPAAPLGGSAERRSSGRAGARERPGRRPSPVPPSNLDDSLAEDIETPDWFAELGAPGEGQFEETPPSGSRRTPARRPASPRSAPDRGTAAASARPGGRERNRGRVPAPRAERGVPSRFRREAPPDAPRPRFGERNRSRDRDRDRDRFPPRDRRSSRDRDRPGSTRRRNLLADYGPSAHMLAFALPRPTEGWTTDQYALHVAIDEETTREAAFRIIDAPRLTGLEPGGRAPFGSDFYRSHTFLAHAGYIDCQVHLADAPVETVVTGRIYSVATGALLAERTAQTEQQGRQTVQLSWENTGWKPGSYRITASVVPDHEIQTEIELIDRITVQDVLLCHKVDPEDGPIGTDWPFYPGDSCHCVVDLGAPPPGVELNVAWYSKDRALETTATRPYSTTAASHQFAAFKLVFRNKQEQLTAGFYSVVVNGPHVVREERSFEVLPVPRVQSLAVAASKSRGRVGAFLKKHHLDGALLPFLGMLLLALVFLVGDAVLAYSLDNYRQSGDAMLRIIQFLGRLRWEWAAGWLVAGAGFGLLQTRQDNNLSSTSEDQVYKLLNNWLAFTSSVLIWYLLSAIFFSKGDLWPHFAGGIFAKLQWLEPVISWLAIPVGLGIMAWSADEDDPFFQSPMWAALGAVAVLFIGVIGALCVGLSLGLIGAIVGELLGVIGIENALGHGMMWLGASVGFFAALGLIGYSGFQDGFKDLWSDWQRAKRSHTSPDFTLLAFLIDQDYLPLKQAEWAQLATIALRAGSVMLVVVIGLAATYHSVVLPALSILYDVPEEALLDQFLTPIVPALIVALVAGLPVAGYGLYRRGLVPLLSAQETAVIRRAGLVALIGLALIPVVVALVSRTAIGDDLLPELAVFWIHRVTALIMILLGVGGCAVLLMNLPEAMRSRLDEFGVSFDFSFEEITVLILAGFAIVFWPAWGWALLFSLLLLVVGGGYHLLTRIK